MEHLVIAKAGRCALLALGLAGVSSPATHAQVQCLSVGYGGGDVKFVPKVLPPDSTKPSTGQKVLPFAVNFGGWVRAAIPYNGSAVGSQIDYQAQNANGGTWHDCVVGGRCEGLDQNIRFYKVEALVFSDMSVWKDKEVAVVIVANTYGPHLRIRLHYTTTLPYCQSLVWDRLEHNRNATLAAMVPRDASILEYGIRARDGDNGSAWAKCQNIAAGHCENGQSEIDIYNLKEVEDGDGQMKGYTATIRNGNSGHARNVELYVNYKMPGQ